MKRGQFQRSFQMIVSVFFLFLLLLYGFRFYYPCDYIYAILIRTMTWRIQVRRITESLGVHFKHDQTTMQYIDGLVCCSGAICMRQTKSLPCAISVAYAHFVCTHAFTSPFLLCRDQTLVFIIIVINIHYILCNMYAQFRRNIRDSICIYHVYVWAFLISQSYWTIILLRD